MKWGYLGTNPQLSTINARAEGITSSPMWSRLISTNRCAVVASGYERAREKKEKRE
jgi:putative SOS response-associated peptidase YedK